MALIYPTPPHLDEQKLALGLAEISNSPLSGSRGQLMGLSVNLLSYTAPHQNWFSNPDALVKGRMLADARAQTWRYLICNGDRCVGELEADPTQQGGASPLLAIHHGDAGQWT